ncbi:hypothetical protein FS749_011025 [Ceratobasidium sp. UAMH 11750]|nr:hypothetical protein FS749_011025 [Ceratobasidium sp. UAMH 11750]
MWHLSPALSRAACRAGPTRRCVHEMTTMLGRSSRPQRTTPSSASRSPERTTCLPLPNTPGASTSRSQPTATCSRSRRPPHPRRPTLEEAPERYGHEPTPEYLQALLIRTTLMVEPDGASENRAAPEQPMLASIPEQPSPAEPKRVDTFPSMSTRSRPSEPGLPPSRLAFDDASGVLNLGSAQ